MARLLREKFTYTELNIWCIDKTFSPFNGVKEYFKKDYEFSYDTPTDAIALVESSKVEDVRKYCELNRSFVQEFKPMADQEILEAAMYKLIHLKQLYQQTKATLEKINPKVTVNIFFHHCVQSYQSYLETKPLETDSNIFTPDCLVTADTNDVCSQEKLGSMPDWQNLCQNTLKANNKAICLALRTDDKKEKDHDAILEEFLVSENEDGQKTFKVIKTVIPFDLGKV